MFARIPLFALPALLLALGLSGCPAPRSTEPGAAVEAPYLFDNLGSQTRIASTDPQAQRYFDQGLRLTYGFNHQAAGFAFAEAARRDPDCAMCVWGQALVLGPNINLPMPPEAAAPAHAFAQRALTMKDKAPTPADRALIEALALRYAAAAPADRKPLDLAYANAMREVARRFPDDDDAATLFAESLMDLSPWAYWRPDGSPNEHAEEIVATLERVLARSPEHTGAIHYYIHAVEASHGPQRAEPYADRLAALAPGAGHLVHMPAHIYIRVGRYHDATVINLAATRADEIFLSYCSGSNGVYPLGYVPHNWHFASMSAGLEGASAMAMNAAERTAQRTDRAQLEALPFMQHFLLTPLYTQVRFGRWDDILAADAPPADLPYPRAIWRFARGMARLRSGDRTAAATELEALQAAAKDPTLAQTAPSTSSNRADALVKIAGALLRGELALAQRRPREAIAALRTAAAMEDGLAYTEPADWPLPIRPYLGAALLAAKRPREAERAFAEDLKAYPDNGWSLTGLAQAQRAQGRTTLAEATEARRAKAWQWADVKLTASRF